MTLADLTLGWPGEPSVVLLQREGDEVVRLASVGPVGEQRPWASVSKLAVALACARECDEGRARDEDPVGETGATLAQLLSHCGGYGFEENDPRYAPGTRRVYSNVGIDRAVEAVRGTLSVDEWLSQRVLRPLDMTETELKGRPSAGLVGSTADLTRLAAEWLAPRLLSEERDHRVTSVFGGDLAGVVPGFGRFDPCPWGLGPEIHGEKNHWMRGWSPAAFGHFGQSGALLLVDRDAGRALVATSSVPFGAWAKELWPAWSARLREWTP